MIENPNHRFSQKTYFAKDRNQKMKIKLSEKKEKKSILVISIFICNKYFLKIFGKLYNALYIRYNQNCWINFEIEISVEMSKR